MNHIEEVSNGAYFVISFSDQTVIPFQYGITTQSVLTVEENPTPVGEFKETHDNRQPNVTPNDEKKAG